MNDIYLQVIELVKCTLNNQIYHETVSRDLFEVAVENGISGTIFKALDKELVDETIYSQFQEEYYQYIKKDQMQLSVLEELRIMFQKEEVDFVFLKGSFIKTIYPESYMRSMGDIDVLVKPEKMQDIHQIMKQNGFKIWSTSKNHDCFMKYKDVNVEIHPKLDSEFSKEYHEFFLEPWKHVIQVDDHGYQLQIEYNFFYQIYHMIKHLYSSGVGFRTIIDLYLILKNYQKTFNKTTFETYLSSFYNQQYIYNIVLYINNVFSETLLSQYLEYGKISKMDHDKFTAFLFVSGIHGIGKKHNIFAVGISQKSEKSKNVFFGKIRFLLSRIFLPYSQMKAMYPFIKKWKLLLPLAWIARIFKLVFKKKSSTLYKLSKLSISKEDIYEVETLFNNMGI